MTIYIRGADATNETRVLSPEASPSWSKPNEPERDLCGEARRSVLRRIAEVVKGGSL